MMDVQAYRFADGARFQAGAKVDNADLVGKHIELLRQQSKGELTPRDVVDDARNANSPLHSFFEWDDSAAAQQFRLQQARGLIRSVVAIYKEDDGSPKEVRAFVHIPEPGTPHYRDTAQAMSQERTREMVLQRAWREFQSWRQRYNELQEFSLLFAAADAVEKAIPKDDKAA